MEVVVLPGHVEEIGVALRARILAGAGIGADVKGFGLEDGLAHGQHDVGKHDAGHEVHLVALDQAVCGLFGGVGAGLVVGHDHFCGQAAELATAVLDGQLKAVTDVHAQASAGSRQRAEQAHLHLVGGMCTTRQHQRGSGHSQRLAGCLVNGGKTMGLAHGQGSLWTG